MPRYLSLFKYTPEGRKGFMKEKAAARTAYLRRGGSQLAGVAGASQRVSGTLRPV
jgi:hypothetical protein